MSVNVKSSEKSIIQEKKKSGYGGWLFRKKKQLTQKEIWLKVQDVIQAHNKSVKEKNGSSN